jgi:hypothetical protein
MLSKQALRNIDDQYYAQVLTAKEPDDENANHNIPDSIPASGGTIG